MSDELYDSIPVGEDGIEDAAIETAVEAVEADTIPVGEQQATVSADAPAAAEGFEEVEDFVAGFEDQNVPDPATVITITTSGGDNRYVPVPEGKIMTAGEAIFTSGLTINGQGGFELYLNNAKIKITDPVPAGSTLMVVASVKGGARA